jgi:hypothetical protein
MDTIWLKIVGFAVLVVGVIVLIGFLTSGTKEPEKTFYDQVEEDKQKFLAEPQPLEEQKKQVPEQNQLVESKEVAEPVPPVQKQVQVQEPKPTVLYFQPLSEIEQIEAEKLINVAVPGRSIGRLPMTGFSLMVPNCRQIIQRWPESQYAYQAKRLLADLPPRYQTRYNVTKEEIDVSMFYKQRPGTQPFTMEDSR